ncbi:hypothetical protein ACIA8C_09945 [Nocardia sp. NPDC051321]|uniref:hypothetical protein n=1 Tax=Nocardia sp. NPDC051321 TaxID=3364323 RepID=UPI0037B0AC5C
MNGDPVEESGQAMRQSTMQAMQTAAMVSGLFARRAGDARSVTEHLQRMRVGDSKEARAALEHRLRVEKMLATVPQEIALNDAKITEVKQRTANANTAHTEAQRRADEDLDRRTKGGDLERKHKKALHKLEIEDKRLQIQIRRRAAGLSDTLTDPGGKAGATGASTAAHAAARASKGLSEENAVAADAFDRRFTEDTGVDPDHFIDATAVPDAEVPAQDVIDAEIVENFEPATTAEHGSVPPRVFVADVTGLTEALTVLTHLEHEFPEAGGDSAQPSADGTGLEAAVADAQPVHASASADADPGLDFGFDPPLELTATPDPELGP